MSKTFKIAIISIFILFGCSLSNNENNNKKETTDDSLIEEKYQEYESYTEYFDKVTSDELYTYENEEETFFLYTGRKTCPHCQIFVPKLYEAYLPVRKNIDNDISITYLDSEGLNDKNLESYREKNNIKYVPNFSYFKNGKLIATLEIYDNISVDEITDFMASFY